MKTITIVISKSCLCIKNRLKWYTLRALQALVMSALVYDVSDSYTYNTSYLLRRRDFIDDWLRVRNESLLDIRLARADRLCTNCSPVACRGIFSGRVCTYNVQVIPIIIMNKSVTYLSSISI